ncbi:MAG: PrgI family protein [Lachnospiraceae bacterium]|nr:PrgI family protein [Lachnospiraceae bacterium]
MSLRFDISKNVDDYKSAIALGLGAAEIAAGIISVSIGVFIILLLYFLIGIHIVVAVYMGMPVIIALCFLTIRKKHGKTFFQRLIAGELIGHKRTTCKYASSESLDAIKAVRENRLKKEKELANVLPEDATNIQIIKAALKETFRIKRKD